MAMDREVEELKVKIQSMKDESSQAYADMGMEFNVCRDEAIASAEAKVEKVITIANQWKDKVVKEITVAHHEAQIELNLSPEKMQTLHRDMDEGMKQIEECLAGHDTAGGKMMLADLNRSLKENKDRVQAKTATFGHLSDKCKVTLGDFQLLPLTFPCGQSMY